MPWLGNTVQTLLLPQAADSATPAEPTPVSFPETAVLDWPLLRASGREEGRYVGHYTDTARQLGEACACDNYASKAGRNAADTAKSRNFGPH